MSRQGVGDPIWGMFGEIWGWTDNMSLRLIYKFSCGTVRQSSMKLSSMSQPPDRPKNSCSTEMRHIDVEEVVDLFWVRAHPAWKGKPWPQFVKLWQNNTKQNEIEYNICKSANPCKSYQILPALPLKRVQFVATHWNVFKSLGPGSPVLAGSAQNVSESPAWPAPDQKRRLGEWEAILHPYWSLIAYYFLNGWPFGEQFENMFSNDLALHLCLGSSWLDLKSLPTQYPQPAQKCLNI